MDNIEFDFKIDHDGDIISVSCFDEKRQDELEKECKNFLKVLVKNKNIDLGITTEGTCIVVDDDIHLDYKVNIEIISF